VAVAVEPRRTALQRTQRVLLVVLGLLFLVLLGTGVWLAFRYQPSGSFSAAHAQSWLRRAHRSASRIFVFTALATFGFSIAVSVERALKRGAPAWVVGLLLMVGALAASFTGYLLPWDELALAPVRVAAYRGFGFLFGHAEVRFVLLGSSEVTKKTVQRWFLVHTIVIPAALVGIGMLAVRVTRRDRLLPLDQSPER